MTDAPTSPATVYRGGRRLLLASAAVGVLGLVLTGVGALLRPRQAGFSYLVSFAYWSGLAVSALALLQAFHASHARWPVALRRVLEVMALTVVPLAVLFVPIALGMKGVFSWTSPPTDLPRDVLEKIEFRTWYLNVPFFLIRAALYFGIWAVVAFFLFRWSVRQDVTGDPLLTVRQRRLAAGALPAVGMAMTFAAYDWLMSPSLTFRSEILGLYWFGGSVVGVLALLVLAGALMDGPDSFGPLLNRDHFHSLGKLMLAFVAFWAWMAFSQGMLKWIANLPDEIPFFVTRSKGGWAWLTGFVVVGQFALPFFALLSRELKRRPRLLATVGIWTLAVHYFDVYWVLMPEIHPGNPAPYFTDLTAFVGIGGMVVAAAVWAVRGRYAAPVRDPDFAASVSYSP
ncbi:MAG: hypothetical protein QM765_25045 [Myxococcales bacterium]